MKTFVVHGCGNSGYELDQDSLSRCLKTIELSNINDKIILTGGVFTKNQNNISVSEAMRKFFIERGYKTIIVENKSRTTIENCEFLLPLLNEDREILVITSSYHILRTSLVWRLFFSKRVKMIGDRNFQLFSTKKIIVEIIGVIVLFLYKNGCKIPELKIRKKRSL
ncbi:MAG: YdcF family protein [Patescibacteria group bacterium]|jgi:hypothetical protein|nr:YdcF family protein [Patescibacteria group bacterium]